MVKCTFCGSSDLFRLSYTQVAAEEQISEGVARERYADRVRDDEGVVFGCHDCEFDDQWGMPTMETVLNDKGYRLKLYGVDAGTFARLVRAYLEER